MARIRADDENIWIHRQLVILLCHPTKKGATHRSFPKQTKIVEIE